MGGEHGLQMPDAGAMYLQGTALGARRRAIQSTLFEAANCRCSRKGSRVRVDKTNQHLRHNPATHWTETMTAGAPLYCLI